jgi:hypothetical protein
MSTHATIDVGAQAVIITTFVVTVAGWLPVIFAGIGALIGMIYYVLAIRNMPEVKAWRLRRLEKKKAALAASIERLSAMKD